MKETHIDLETWERKDIFRMFSAVSNPFYSVSFEVDVTKAHEYAKAHSLSFYLCLTWLVTKACSCCDAFLFGLRDGELIRYEKRLPSFTDMKKGSELFHIVTTDCEDDIEQFCRRAKALSEAQTMLLDISAEADNLIYISCLPWLPMTSLVGERDFNADDSIPRITWGAYTEHNGKLKLNMAMDVNHRFIDGLHIGKFYSALCNEIEKLQ